MRKELYSTYKGFNRFTNKVIDFAIVHSTKLALVCMFAVSVTFPNLFNTLLFLNFLIFSMISPIQVKKYWNVPIIINSIIISGIYAFDVFT